ncbi:hypothetical protein KW823_00525 [Enterobacter quasiroggenkampii]|nr:hypothetical protein [Enterobacter quasiroggenkampii]
MAKRGPKPKTHDNTNVMNYLKGKHISKIGRQFRAVLDTVTDKSQFHNEKGGNNLYVFVALQRVQHLTNEEVAKCIESFRAEDIFNKVITSMPKDFVDYSYAYWRSNFYDSSTGYPDIEFLRTISDEYKYHSLFAKSNKENYGKAAREASIMIEQMITVPTLDPVLQQMIEDAVKSDKKNKKLIQELLKKLQ